MNIAIIQWLNTFPRENFVFLLALFIVFYLIAIILRRFTNDRN